MVAEREKTEPDYILNAVTTNQVSDGEQALNPPFIHQPIPIVKPEQAANCAITDRYLTRFLIILAILRRIGAIVKYFKGRSRTIDAP